MSASIEELSRAVTEARAHAERANEEARACARAREAAAQAWISAHRASEAAWKDLAAARARLLRALEGSENLGGYELASIVTSVAESPPGRDPEEALMHRDGEWVALRRVEADEIVRRLAALREGRA